MQTYDENVRNSGKGEEEFLDEFAQMLNGN